MTTHLESLGLLREYRGVWQYRMFADGPWYSANSRHGAIESAQALYDRLPESERLTQAQRDAATEAARDAQNEAMYGDKTDAELQAMVLDLEARIAGFRRGGKRQYSANGHCYTGAAVSNAAARDLGEIKMRLAGYMARRGVAA